MRSPTCMGTCLIEGQSGPQCVFPAVSVGTGLFTWAQKSLQQNPSFHLKQSITVESLRSGGGTSCLYKQHLGKALSVGRSKPAACISTAINHSLLPCLVGRFPSCVLLKLRGSPFSPAGSEKGDTGLGQGLWPLRSGHVAATLASVLYVSSLQKPLLNKVSEATKLLPSWDLNN